MVFRRVLEWPDKSLNKKSRDFNFSSDQEAKIDLLDTFRVLGGYGLAAPQIGFNVRAIVVNMKALAGLEDQELLMINPVILEKNQSKNFKEFCFSLPGMEVEVERYSEILVEWLDEKETRKEGKFVDYAAVCIQHEIDHLDGLLSIDRISSLRKDRIIKKVKKNSLKLKRLKGGDSKEEASKKKSFATRAKNRKRRKSKK